jgi:hypothetical protein
MLPEIKDSFGASMTQQIENLLNVTSSLFEENFGEVRNRLDEV